jgi:hypothetical protein
VQTPSRFGPRHCGQSAAAAAEPTARATTREQTTTRQALIGSLLVFAGRYARPTFDVETLEDAAVAVILSPFDTVEWRGGSPTGQAP